MVFKGSTQKEVMRIRGVDISTVIGEMPHIGLRFYPDNPRIYSFVCAGKAEPSQEEIFEKLRAMEHVKQLVQSIKLNDGLIEPIIVRDNVVLEGNSRLAAYRLLYDKDPIKWGLIKAQVFPSDTRDDLVYALLAEFHLIGKKDWAPYEQAGFLYRQQYIHGIDQKRISVESGISKKKVSHLISVYKFMIDRGQDDPSKWSYYDEYLKSRDMRKMREEFPDLDSIVIEKIESEEIPRAVDLRSKLKVIARSNLRNRKKFVTGERNFEQAYEAAANQGVGSNCFDKLHSFRKFICDLDTEKKLAKYEKCIQGKCHYELKKIQSRAAHLERRLKSFID